MPVKYFDKSVDARLTFSAWILVGLFCFMVFAFLRFDPQTEFIDYFLIRLSEFARELLGQL